MSTTKKVLLGCGIAFAGVLILLIAGGALFYKFAVAPMVKMPSALRSPGVVHGQGFVTCKEFLSDPRLGKVTDIRFAELAASTGRELGIAGTKGAVFTDARGNPKSWVAFADTGRHVDLIDAESDGIYEFMGRGNWRESAVLMDDNGKRIWEYGALPGVDDMAAGDMDGDGRLEFVVGFNGSGGVHLLNASGVMRWKQPDGNVWHVEITDTDGNGTNEIVHSNAAGEIVIMDNAGAVISSNNPKEYFSGFSLCHWPTKEGRLFALSAEDDTIWVSNFDGSSAATLDAPHSGSLGTARGAPVRLQQGKPEYLAVVVDVPKWNTSLLYIYDRSGKLQYQEVLGEICQAIAALPDGSTGKEMLLLGGDNRVLQYSVPAGN